MLFLLLATFLFLPCACAMLLMTPQSLYKREQEGMEAVERGFLAVLEVGIEEMQMHLALLQDLHNPAAADRNSEIWTSVVIGAIYRISWEARQEIADDISKHLHDNHFDIESHLERVREACALRGSLSRLYGSLAHVVGRDMMRDCPVAS